MVWWVRGGNSVSPKIVEARGGKYPRELSPEDGCQEQDLVEVRRSVPSRAGQGIWVLSHFVNGHIVWHGLPGG